jgi:hypothetical protein
VDPEPTFSLPAGATLLEYVEDLRSDGVRVAAGGGETYWVATPHGVVRRVPTFHVDSPDPSEVDAALRASGAVVASYVTAPADGHPANAWLYLCADRGYALDGLPPTMRRNVKRAARELTIAPLTGAELLAHGARAFSDTRRRTGLDRETVATFRRYFAHRGYIDRPGRAFLGAWKDGQLAAFVKALHVDDWVELTTFAMDSMLRYRPNDALLYGALSHYLGRGGCRVVSFGLSSIQASSNIDGLHRFKLKVGFTPTRVHRAFVLHPSLRPLANRVTLRAARRTVNGALRVRPRSRRLTKLEGMLTCMLQAT